MNLRKLSKWPHTWDSDTQLHTEKKYRGHIAYILKQTDCIHRATYPYDDEIGFGHFIYYIEMLSFALFAISNLFEISLR